MDGRIDHPLFLLLIALLVPLTSQANERVPDSVARSALRVLEERCLSCHNDVDRSGKLSLETRRALVDSGFAVPGDPHGSYLLEVLDNSADAPPQMPKDGEPLSDSERSLLRNWIAAGLPWPEGYRLQLPSVDDFDWWSFRPLRRPPVPQFPAGSPEGVWIRSPVDAFVLQEQQERNLPRTDAADARTLIRRLCYDLTGLPPTPEEVRSFTDDRDPFAWEQLVDRLLASPHYGERWARHWLDVVKYADTCGYDKDKLRPHAWPYRDYVIHSFNEDKPYARFVEEQIAGDILFPGEADGILGLGFIAAGPWDFVGHVEVSESKIDGRVARNLDRDDMVSNTLNTFCSVTIQCARCHNHKFDPYTQEHYYSLQAVFAAVDRADRSWDSSSENQLVYAAATDFTPQSNFQPTRGIPRPVHVLHRGEITQPLQDVSPGVIPLDAEDDWKFDLSEGHAEGERRAALARWLTHPDNPLTWRSVVNRVWQYHFGDGLVATANDFGRMGQPPTHPELLDWLAVELRDSGGSWKHLHRLILGSATWRQATIHNPAAAETDSTNRYLWRQNRRRLSAEELRDSILMVSGRLQETMGGPGYYLFELEKTEHSPHYEYHKFDPDDPASHRRSIYRFIVRSQPDPFMTTLDCADSSQSTPRRTETFTPLQALSLLNNRFTLTIAEHFAARLESESDDFVEQICRGFAMVTGRLPTAEELRTLDDYARRHGMPAVCRLLFNLNESIFLD